MNNSEEEVRDIQYGVPQKLFFNFAILFGLGLLNGVQIQHKKLFGECPYGNNTFQKGASLTNSCLVDLFEVTLACENPNSKLVDVITVANFDDVDRVGNSLLQIWELRFGHKTKLLFRL